MTQDRLPPHDIDAEKAALGSCLIDPGAVLRIEPLVGAEAFYRAEHRDVAAALYRLAGRGAGIDVVTVADESGVGLSYMADLASSVPTSIHAETYAATVAKLAVRRQLLDAAGQIGMMAWDDKQDVDEAIAKAEILVGQSHRRDNRGAPVRDHMSEYYDKLERLSREGNGDAVGLSTGFKDIDRLMRLDGYVVLAGRPSMGKSSLALDIARYLVRYQKRCVAYFSLENSAESVVTRLVSKETGMAVDDLRRGQVRDWGAFMTTFTDYSDGLGDLLWLDDTPGLSVPELRARAMRYHAKVGVDLVVVDYLQLMYSGDRRRDGRMIDRVSDVSQGLKALARVLDCPVLAVSQLSRACEQRVNKRPMLSDLRESGSIEQDADVVLFVYRDGYYNEDTENPNIAEIIVAKNRDGPTGTASLWYKQECTKFQDAEVRAMAMDAEGEWL